MAQLQVYFKFGTSSKSDEKFGFLFWKIHVCPESQAFTLLMLRSNLGICYYLLFSLPHNLIYVCFKHHKYFFKIKIRTVHKLYKRMFSTIGYFGFQDNS